MTRLLFVYGTLKRTGSNHHQLAGGKFVAEACTVPGFALYDFGGFPALAQSGDNCEGVRGEVWEVSEQGVQQLDEFEGLAEGLYRRAPVALLHPFSHLPVDTYYPAQNVTGRRRIGAEWLE